MRYPQKTVGGNFMAGCQNYNFRFYITLDRSRETDLILVMLITHD
ncbi:hypothetical protein [Chamaesiphon sp. VAR_48_metabat_403]|nr:hypothetical protein [Chamaesiphon sp. VAR_48_metabat_403]